MTNRTLILWRHAKSAWDDANLQDYDRPLAPRGLRAAPLMARWIQKNCPGPDAIICSPARRARQTLQAYLSVTEDASLTVRLLPIIYEATPVAIINEVKECKDAKTVLLVGHNPSLQDLALQSLRESAFGQPEAHRLIKKFPTAAACVLQVQGTWNDLKRGSAKLIAFTRPKDLDEWRA